MKYSILCFFACISVAFSAMAVENTDANLVVNNQYDFDRISSNVNSAIKSGKRNITIDIKPGEYAFKNRHLLLKPDCTGVTVNIVGRGAKLYGCGENVSKSFDYNSSHIKDATPVDLWGAVMQMSELISVVDADAKLCKAKMPAGCVAEAGDLVQVSQWYETSVYEVKKVSGGYLYFIADDLRRIKSAQEWSVNYDYIYGKAFPRMRVFKSHLANTRIYECQTCNFLTISGNNLKSVTLQGLTFIGNSYSNSDSVIRVNGLSSGSVTIQNCAFDGCASECVGVVKSKNVHVRDCDFSNNAVSCVYADNWSSNISVESCHFANNGTRWSNFKTIIMSCQDFYVGNNVMCNSYYAFIGVGVWLGHKCNVPVSGIVEKNEMYYTQDFFDRYKEYTLMDSGAIYTWTQNDDVTIRYNRIHDYIGMKDNRGIFCDDGTRNVKIYGNVITNIPNSYCIDLRACPSVESEAKRPIGKVNVGNLVRDNIVDGTVRFEGRKGGNNGCVKGKNIVVVPEGAQLPKMKVKDLDKAMDDVYVPGVVEKDGTILISRKAYNKVKSSSEYNEMKQWIRK